jgi:hypothetical protein
MCAPQRFRVNAPLVAMQEIEGEAILINFDTGCYYSANATGAIVLDLIQRGEPVDSVVAALVARFGVAGTLGADAVSAFLREAQAGGLIVPSDSEAATTSQETAQRATSRAVEAAAFVPPRLEKFDDLQDLLMLDPIHDVDQVGWPMPAPPPEPSPPQSTP